MEPVPMPMREEGMPVLPSLTLPGRRGRVAAVSAEASGCPSAIAPDVAAADFGIASVIFHVFEMDAVDALAERFEPVHRVFAGAQGMAGINARADERVVAFDGVLDAREFVVTRAGAVIVDGDGNFVLL